VLLGKQFPKFMKCTKKSL